MRSFVIITPKLKLPEPKRSISIRVDQDVLDYFKNKGQGLPTKMNAVLRMFMETQTPGVRKVVASLKI